MIKFKTLALGDLAANCYVVVDEPTGECAVIDPGAFNNKLDELLSEVGYDNIKYVLLTHAHFDHMSGTNEVVAHTGGKAKVAVGSADIPLLSDSMTNLAYPFSLTTLDEIPCDIPLKDNDKLSLGESEFTVISTPGHTKGSVCFMCDDVIFTGDTLFAGSAGRTDFPSGSYDELKKSLSRLSSLEGNYKICPGHDRATTLQHERESNLYMVGESYDNIY